MKRLRDDYMQFFLEKIYITRINKRIALDFVYYVLRHLNKSPLSYNLLPNNIKHKKNSTKQNKNNKTQNNLTSPPL